MESIARNFSWSRFATVVVTPVEGRKFAIIDGQYRTTAAALAGFEAVPCQIVTAACDEQAVAFRAINRGASVFSRMALHAAGVVASDPSEVRLADACARAQVELLRYPVPVDRQAAGQTMAIGAVARCLKRYGEETLITALQCVTQTNNNRPGALSARTIKALCALLGGDQTLRDSGLALLDIFDVVDLQVVAEESAAEAAAKNIDPVQAMVDGLRLEIRRLVSRKPATPDSPRRVLEVPSKSRISFVLGKQRPARGSGRRSPKS